MIGVVLRTHDQPPKQTARAVLQLLDEEPALGQDLLRLGKWIAEYYCAPLGEVLRGMLPLTGEIRRATRYSLTDLGRDVARQLVTMAEPDTATRILQLLEERSRSAAYLAGKAAGAKTALRGLMKRGWITTEEEHAARDPLRAAASRLEVEFLKPRRGRHQTEEARARIARFS